MSGEARILISGIEVGPHTDVLPLNASFRPDVPLMKLQVEIDWNPPHPHQALPRLEEQLAELCPGLREHKCRGHFRYHILRSGEAARAGQEPIEASLALAHLLEHVLIDMIAYVMSAPRLSGITGAHRDSLRRFDIFVECPDPAVAPLLARLAVSWIAALLGGESVDGGGRETLELAHLLYCRRPEGLALEEIARQLCREPDEIRRTLLWLERNGFARQEPSGHFKSSLGA